jgi:hypothetical protein
MKNYTKIGIVCLAFLMAFSALTPMVYGETTIDDTTFPADVDTRYQWRYTYPSYASGYKLGFTADSITQGIHNTVESLIVVATIEIYIPVNDTGWEIITSYSFYLAANETQDYLSFDYNSLYLPFVIPTPINLILVGEAIVTFPDIDSYFIDGNSITFDFGFGETDVYTFKDNGFLSTAEHYSDGDLTTKLSYGAGGDEAIPLSNYFIIPTFISIAIIVIFVKKRCLQLK